MTRSRGAVARGLAAALVAGVVWLGVACSAGGEAPTKDCSAGTTRACTCAGGESGSQFCTADGFWRECTCVGACPPGVTPSCFGKPCGSDDGCGNSCKTGTCPTDQKCVDGTCRAGACFDCSGKACGADDGCGKPCLSGSCKPGYTCNSGKCECKPVCVSCGADDGCGGTCATGACPDAGFKCLAGGCAVDPASKWVVKVTTGTLPVDKGWNSLGAPEPIVCLWIGGTRLCTQEGGSTLTPTWGCSFPAVSAATLKAGIDVEMFDNDRSGPGICAEVVPSPPGDVICAKGTVPVTDAQFKARTWSAKCTDMSFNATLTPL